MANKNLIGQNIRLARSTADPKITQDRLATQLEVLGCPMSRAVISKIENGDRRISDIEIVAFAKALNVNVEWLFEDFV